MLSIKLTLILEDLKLENMKQTSTPPHLQLYLNPAITLPLRSEVRLAY